MITDYQVLDERYEVQAGWTEYFQRRLLHSLKTSPPWKVLEIGCGTGAILRKMQSFSSENFKFYGLDIDISSLKFGQSKKAFPFICGNGYLIPFQSGLFDLVFCHYLLLWITDPVGILKEMKRNCKPEGLAAVIAEPDYSARIGYPEYLEIAGIEQTNVLTAQGIDPKAGRKLANWMIQAGFMNPTVGIHGIERPASEQYAFVENEKIQYSMDIGRNISASGIEVNQTEIFYVPTFFAYAVKP
jgi:ubiquinone/menaquinone biosynthesis C-methylase UbiE